jgi:hypothetical protein
MTFVVRVREAAAGELAGTVERLRTGEKQPFRGIDALARLIEEAVQAARAEAEHERGREPS